ncbi:MAG: HD domain-containing protein [Planctomycetales bacterium]
MAWGERLDAAFLLASELHREQTRKTRSIPYLSHLMSVAALVAEAGGTEDEVIAALLHDAAEDQGGQAILDRIREEFGDAVADVVEGCSDSLADTTAPGSRQEKAPWRERKETYIAHLAGASSSVLLVSCADKLHNARCLVIGLREVGPDLWDRFNGGRRTLWYYQELLIAFRAGEAPSLLLDDLARVVLVLEELAAED